MAEVNPPGWLQNAGATHPAAPMRSFVTGLLGPAVSAGSLIPAGGVNAFLGNKLFVQQTGSPSMAVVVRSGVAYVPGSEHPSQGAYSVENDADLTLAVTSNGSGLARIDSVFFKVQDTQYSGGVNSSSLVVVAGTPSGSPVPPTAPANSIRLADIAVANGAVSITNANITDRRTFISGAAGAGVDVQRFTTGGTWTKPAGAQFIDVLVVAGGGGSGGCAATGASTWAVAAGGGGGGWSQRWAAASVAGATETVTVGAGGSAGASGFNSGGAGGNSSFGAICTASGGSGGGGGGAAAGAACNGGGSAGVGTTASGTFVNGTGASGSNGVTIAPGGIGSQGYGGGTLTAGMVRTTANVTSVAAANPGQLYGGGAAGGNLANSQAAIAGAAGAAGIVIVVTYL